MRSDDLELVIFDLAGTTIQDTGQVPEAFQSALLTCGIEVTPRSLSDVRGASKREAIRRLVEQQFAPSSPAQIEAQSARVYDAFREHLAKLYSTGGVAVLPGVAETFESVDRPGH